LTGTQLNRDPTEGVKVKYVLICQEQYPLMLGHCLSRLLDTINLQHHFVFSMLRVVTLTRSCRADCDAAPLCYVRDLLKICLVQASINSSHNKINKCTNVKIIFLHPICHNSDTFRSISII